MAKISVVINTFNEENNIEKAIKSVSWADEIIVCDMYSQDKTAEIAKKLGARVIFYKNEGYVEPARNIAISKAKGEWILVLDADEEIPQTLSKRLKEFAKKPISSDYVEIPRKNIIFGKWMEASGWWPDYQVRFFKKGKVIWQEKIHSKPKTLGNGINLEAEEKWAITHYNYQTLEQFIERMNRYTGIEAEQLIKDGYKFSWKDLFENPFNEFFSRFFVREGYKDGLHGLALSLLQAFSFLVVYLKIWQLDSFEGKQISLSEVEQEVKKSTFAMDYWFRKSGSSKNIFKTLLQKFKR